MNQLVVMSLHCAKLHCSQNSHRRHSVNLLVRVDFSLSANVIRLTVTKRMVYHVESEPLSNSPPVEFAIWLLNGVD